MGNRKVAVIGGAIGGPACVLAFRRAGGYEVACYEARDEATTTSAGILGLRPWTLNMLADLGIDRGSIVPHNIGDVTRHTVAGRQVVEATEGQLPSRKVPWAVLHNALDALVGDLQYGMRVTSPPDADLIIWADGVGSVGRHLLDPDRGFTYGGYMSFRGITDAEPQYFDWAVFEDPLHFLMNVTPTLTPEGERVEWTVFLPWPFEQGLQHFVPKICSRSTEIEFRALARNLIPPRLLGFINATSSPISAVAIGDWAMPSRMVFGGKGEPVNIIIGDALCALRPHTAMGANMAIGEACSLPRAVSEGWVDMWEQSWLADLAAQHARGIELGKHYALDLTVVES